MKTNQALTAAIDPAAMSKIQIMFMIGSLSIALILSVLFYMHALTYPSCCDSSQYVEMARYFEDHGFSPYAPHSDVRTFGYPWILSLISHAAAAAGVPFLAAVFFVQLAMYFACVAIIYRLLLRSFGFAAGAAAFYGLTLNVLVLPYLSLTMTDGMSVILLLVAACILIGLSADDRSRNVALRAVMLGFVVGFAVVVRPANLWFVALILVGALLIYRKRHGDPSRPPSLGTTSFRGALIFVVMAVLAGTAATMPQSALNWTKARQASPLPVYDLKEKQLDAGVRYIKYGTNMVGGASGLFYTNPLYIETDGRHGIEWYFRDPLRGSATLALRMFGGFDFDYLFPYVYDLRPKYRPVLLLFSQFVVFFGFGGIVLLIYPKLAKRVLGEVAAEHFRWRGPIGAGKVFVPVVVAWAAIHGVSAIENRFALPMVTVLMPVAIAALWALFSVFHAGRVKRGLWILAGFIAWITTMLPIIRILDLAKQIPPI